MEHLLTVTDGRDGWTQNVTLIFIKAFVKKNSLNLKPTRLRI